MAVASPFGLPIAIMQALLNKSPKEGPRYVPLAFNFSTTTSWLVDLTQEVQGGKLSAIQTFFVDNSANTEPVEIAMGIGGGQVIQLDAGQQGWVSCLQNNNPQFVVSSTGTTCNVFACNFQTFNAVWYAKGAAGGTGEAVNLTEVGGATIALGQTVMANSLPVAIASNQSPIPSNLNQVGGVAFSTGQATANSSLPVVLASNQTPIPIAAFLVQGTVQNLAVTTSSASATIAAVINGAIRLVNVGTVAVFVRTGTGSLTAVDTDLCIPPNEVCYLASNSATAVAAITASGTASLNIAVGTGAGAI